MSGGDAYEPPVPWGLAELLAEGAAPLVPRPVRDPDELDVVVIAPPGATTVAEAGLPDQMLDAVEAHGASVTVLTWEETAEAADADVLLAAGWAAAPSVLRTAGVRARGVLATAEPPLLAAHGWTAGVPVIAPRWLGGRLDAGVDEHYGPRPDHRRDGVVHVHGRDELMLLVAGELAARRPELEITISGLPFPVSLPFPATAVDGDADSVARAFALATVGLAPPVRGWRPVATAMAACGLPVVTADGEAARLALADAAALVDGPAAGADAAEALLDDLALRAERARAGSERVTTWDVVGAQIVAELRRW